MVVLWCRQQKKSGARITAQYALDQGREVFAVPGSVNDERSAGCHQLIKEGATLVSCADDVLREFESIIVPNRISACASGYSANRQSEKKDTEVIDETDVQARIIRLCAIPQLIDELIEQTESNLVVVQEKLVNLQLAGKIQQDFTGRWTVV